FMVTKAKLTLPEREKVEQKLLELENFITLFKNSYDDHELPYQNFGLNKKIPDYFHRETYAELLAARSFFTNRTKGANEHAALIFSCFAHVFHVNRPYALS